MIFKMGQILEFYMYQKYIQQMEKQSKLSSSPVEHLT